MTTLITGAGLVGSLAAARLLREYGDKPVLVDIAFPMQNLAERVPLTDVTLVRADVTNVAEIVDAIQRHRPERIIHTAAFLTSTVRERPYAGVQVNLGGTQAVFEAARLTGVKRVVFSSSATVYFGLTRPPEDGVLREDQPLRLITEHPPSVYAAAKVAAEWLGHRYRLEHGREVVTVRFGAVYGPWRGTPSGGPTRLLQEVVEAAHANRPARLKASDLRGGAMDFVYAADCAQGAVKAAFVDKPLNWVYNIGEGVARNVPRIIEIVEQVTGRPLKIDVLDEGSSETGYAADTWPLDLSRSRADLRYEVEFPMAVAIRDYLGWLDR